MTPIQTIRSTLPVLASVLLAACVAKDPDSLGELESGNDSGATSSGGATEGEASEGSSATEGETSSETGTPVDPCPDPALSYHEPASCPDEGAPLLPAAGCYEPCDGPGAPCGVGACVEVQTNPCVCAEGEDCCAACGALTWLCVEDPPGSACEQIVGSTFWSVDELECGLGPKGVELCHWTVMFEEDGDYLWQYSHLEESGTYACVGGVITVLSVSELEATYDPESGILTWDGVDYVSIPPK